MGKNEKSDDSIGVSSGVGLVTSSVIGTALAATGNPAGAPIILGASSLGFSVASSHFYDANEKKKATYLAYYHGLSPEEKKQEDIHNIANNIREIEKRSRPICCIS